MTAAKTPATFGAWMRTRRRQLDLTQSELGQRAGCSEAAIRKIEADERKPSRQLAELLTRALEIPDTEQELFFQFARGILIDEIRIEVKSHPNNLPTLLTSTVDRTRDLANVTTLLKDKSVHLVTLIGTPGIGKTRLSVHCGSAMLDEFPDGVWFVDLAELANADFLIPTIARFIPTLNLPPSFGLPQLLNSLRDRTLLLILDNFEQIVEGASLDVAQILKACPKVKIMVTSRVPLHIYGENEYLLPPLSIPSRDVEISPEKLMQFESVQLFVARTRQHQPGFVTTSGNASAIIEICSTLEGIPLAIELAAASLRQMTLDEMVALLRQKDWVKQIATQARDLPQRQRTLENVIDWSYTLLDDAQKDFFCKLGVFSNWLDSEAATAVCETSPTKSHELLLALTDHSLLVREIIKDKTHWRMLELIHEYAASRLSSEELVHVESLRAQYFLNKFRELRQYASPETQEGYFQVNFSNFYSALKWTIAERRTELGFQLISTLEDIWSSLGYFKEGLDLLIRLLALPSELEPARRADFMQTASDLAWQQHDFETAVTYSKEALELGRVHGLVDQLPWFYNRLGRIYIEQGKLLEARQALNSALDMANQYPSILNPGSPLAQLGEVSLFEGKLEQAQSLLEQALTHLTERDGIFLAVARTDLAEVALLEGDYKRARSWLAKSIEPSGQHVRRFIVFLCALAGYLASAPERDKRKAAHLYGAINSLIERSGVILNLFYQTQNQKRIGMVRQSMSEKAWQVAFETGRQWDKEEILANIKEELGL